MSRFLQLYGLTKKEIARILKVPMQTIGAPLINAMLYMVLFGIGLPKLAPSQQEYFSFLLPGLIALITIRNAFDNSSGAIMIAKYLGEMQDLRVAPLSAALISTAKNLASTFRGLLLGFFIYTIGEIILFFDKGIFLQIEHPLLLISILWLSSWTFSELGIACAMKSKTFEGIGAVSSFLLIPLTYLGGVFFDPSSFGMIWKQLSLCNPLYHAISLIRYSFNNTPSTSPILSFFILVFSLGIFHFASRKYMNEPHNYVR